MVVSLKLKEAEDTGQYSLPLVYFPSLHSAGEPSDLVSIFHHPRVVEAEVTEQDSLLLTRNFLGTAMFNRGLFYLDGEYLKLIMPMHAESHRLIEKVSSRDSYSNSQAVMLNISLTGNKSHGGTFKSTADVSLNQLRSSTFKMLGELMSTLDKMPDEPQDYKPPFFWGCLENEAQYLLAKNPLRVEVGNVNSKRLVFTLKITHSQANYLELTDVFSNFPHLSLAISEDIMDQLETEVVISETGKDTYVKNRDKGKSVLEPCENENDFMQDDEKRTRPVTTKHARCKFLAEGFCPFGDECWFCHHVGGDEISCCIFSCEASGSYSKGKSVLEPCENEKDFMQDDGKRTRPVTTKNARCKFLAEGFCPFGDECWFCHHVGGDGTSCCMFSCEASGSYSKGKRVLEPCENENYLDTLELKKESEAVGDDDTSREFVLGRCCWDTSVSKVFRKPELSLAGVQPSNNNKRLENVRRDVRRSVRAKANRALTPSELMRIFGEKLYNICCKKGVPTSFSCLFERYREKDGGPIYHNQFLGWRCPNRSPNWIEGVTRVDREWVELSEEDKKKVGEPIRSKQEDEMVGDVRDQEEHQLCAAYVCVNLVSSLRVIKGRDKKFVNLSVKELCFNTSPSDRSHQASEEHNCHTLLLTSGLQYIRDFGVRVQRGGDSFNCVTDKPKERKGEKMIQIAGYVYLGNDLHRALKTLETQPIGATLLIFSDYWKIRKGEIYRGPTSDSSWYQALHGVTVVDAFLMNGELVFWCKSSHGPKSHDKGYILVSGEMMVMGHHFAGRGDSTFGLNRGIGGDTALALSQPKPLIHEFVYPILELETKKRKSSNPETLLVEDSGRGGRGRGRGGRGRGGRGRGGRGRGRGR